jgi:hypothetical protein
MASSQEMTPLILRNPEPVDLWAIGSKLEMTKKFLAPANLVANH